MSDDKSIFDERTLYSLDDEYGDRTTLTLDKISADVLQRHLPDVHAWVELVYSHVVDKRPDLTRREKGDVVRRLVQREAERYPDYEAKLTQILGM